MIVTDESVEIQIGLTCAQCGQYTFARLVGIVTEREWNGGRIGIHTRPRDMVVCGCGAADKTRIGAQVTGSAVILGVSQ